MGDLDDALANAAATTELHFRYGEGAQLDGRIGQLVNLRELQLRDVPADCVLPEELLALPLVELGLSGANDKLVVPALVPRLPITRLTVWDLHASELPPLPRLERLEIVVQDPKAEVPVLAERFSHLRELRIWGSHLEQGELPADIERFRRLEVLELISCGVRTLPDALAKLDTLRRFEIRGCPMDQFPEVLTRMPKLEVIEIGEPIAGLPATLGNMRALRELGLGHAFNKGAMLSRWDDIATMKALPKVLGELANLERLDIDCCGVFDIAPLRTLKKLKKLSMSWSAVTTVEPLGALSELEALSIEHADRVRDLSPLAACKKLVTLNISNTRPKSLDFLRELPALKHLHVEGLESKKIDAIYDLEVELEADDEIKARYAARSQLREMPRFASIVQQLAARDLQTVETACEQLATWAAASSTREENAIVALGIKSALDEDDDEDDDNDDEDDDDEDDDEYDDDDDEGDDDAGAIRAGGALPALDTALDRYLAQLSGRTLARLFGVLFHDVGDHFPAALRIANELVSRGDDEAQCLLADGFIAACEHYDAGHREHDYTVHDLLHDEVFPLLGGAALAKLLAWAPPDALDSDGMSALFAPAIARARGADLASVMEHLEIHASRKIQYTGGPQKIEALWATLPRDAPGLAELHARLDAQLAAVRARADRAKRLEQADTAPAALDEIVELDDAGLKEYQGALWCTNDATPLPARSRRKLLQLWERLGHENGIPDVLMTAATYVPIDELRGDLDAIATTGAARGAIVRRAITNGLAHDIAAEHLEKLRVLATELDGMPRVVADSAEVRALLFERAAQFDQAELVRGVTMLANLPVYTPPPLDDDEPDHASDFASMVAHLAECQEYEPLQALSRHLAKLAKHALWGHTLERVLAQLVGVGIVANDPEGVQAVLPLVPPEITWDILAYNLACKYARESDRDGTFRYTRRALELGKSPEQFLRDPDFEVFVDDVDFKALLDAHR